MESLSLFGEQVGFNAETDILVFYIGMQFEADSLSEITYSQFEKACKNLGVDDANTWKNVIPRLRQQLSNQSKHKDVYKAAFGFNIEPPSKNIGIDIAIALWDLFITEQQCQFMGKWKQFLEKKNEKGELLAITRDNWDLFYELHEQTGGDLRNFEDDGGWPTLFDEFIEFMESQ